MSFCSSAVGGSGFRLFRPLQRNFSDFLRLEALFLLPLHGEFVSLFKFAHCVEGSDGFYAVLLLLLQELVIELITAKTFIGTDCPHPGCGLDAGCRQRGQAVAAAVVIASGELDPGTGFGMVKDVSRSISLGMKQHADQQARHFVDTEGAKLAETCLQQWPCLLLDCCLVPPLGR